MRFCSILTSCTTKDDHDLQQVVSCTDGKVKGDKRKSIIEGVLHALVVQTNSHARQSAIKNGRILLEYSDEPGLFKVTGMRYTLEKSDLQMMNHLLNEPLNQRVWFPESIGCTERRERELVIRIIADQAEGLGQ